MPQVYKKVVLIVGFDPEKDSDPAKMNWSKKGVTVKLLKVEDTEEPDRREKVLHLIEARLLKNGMSIRHPDKGILTVKSSETGMPGSLRIVFVDSQGGEHIVMSKFNREFDKVELPPVAKVSPSKTPRKKKVRAVGPVEVIKQTESAIEPE